MTFAGRTTIHIGAPKTATTSLEENLYECHPEILNIGRPFRHGPPRSELCRALDGDPSSYAAQVRRFCEAEASTRRIVLGDDNICSIFVANKEVPAKLRAIFGDARIILTIRNQMSAIPSSYLQYSEQQDFSFSDWAAHHKAFLLAQYDYHGMVRAFETVFGRENIGVFLFETLTENVGDFTRPICDFIGVDANVGVELMSRPDRNPRISARELLYLRIKGKMFKNRSLGQLLPSAIATPLLRFVQGGRGAHIQWGDALANDFAEAFRHGNRALAKQFNLDIDAHGYPL